MTKKEIIELFGVMRTAWPNAEPFRSGDMKALEPTVLLWANAAADMDFRFGQMALLELVKTSRFPPTVAEFREAAALVRKKLEAEADQQMNFLHMAQQCGSLETYYNSLSVTSRTKRIIAGLGGLNSIQTREPDGTVSVDWWKLREAYVSAALGELPAAEKPPAKQIGGGK